MASSGIGSSNVGGLLVDWHLSQFLSTLCRDLPRHGVLRKLQLEGRDLANVRLVDDIILVAEQKSDIRKMLQ